MPITMEFVQSRKHFRRTTVTGPITDTEIARHREMLVEFMTELGDVLIDMREADVRHVTSNMVISTARMLNGESVLASQRRIAIVAPEDGVFGLSRMLQQLADGAPPTVRVFREYVDAARWIESDA